MGVFTVLLRPGRCGCGVVFIGPRNQRYCADCGAKRHNYTKRRWKRRQRQKRAA